MSGMKSTLNGNNSRLDFEEEKIKNRLHLNVQQWKPSGEKKEKNGQNISDLWNASRDPLYM